VVHFEITPKAFANFSPGLERSDNPGTYETKKKFNAESIEQTALANAFCVGSLFSVNPRG
jgi:hypothetical protein